VDRGRQLEARPRILNPIDIVRHQASETRQFAMRQHLLQGPDNCLQGVSFRKWR
jgi:hypothetical protein